MKILFLLVGSFGDIYPIFFLIQKLIKLNHEIRICTHQSYKGFFDENIEFFGMNCDPKDLVSSIIKTPNILLTKTSEKEKRLSEYEIIFETCWDAATKSLKNEKYHPDVIIANPPIFIHIYISEILQSHLQIWFSMPWYKTSKFRHPMVQFGNFYFSDFTSYYLFDWISYFGVYPLINQFLKKKGLEKYNYIQKLDFYSLNIPHVFMFSKHLIEKPMEWGDNVSIIGNFQNQKLDSKIFKNKLFETNSELETFIEENKQKGFKFLYVGFGSMTMENENYFSKIFNFFLKYIFEKYRFKTIFCRGWSKIVFSDTDYIFEVNEYSHEYLFPRMDILCHHGGCGTVHKAIVYEKPSMIISFLCDQNLWGEILFNKRIGSKPITFNKISNIKLLKRFLFCIDTSTIENCKKFGKLLLNEEDKSVEIFNKYTPVYKNYFFKIIYEVQYTTLFHGWGESEFYDKTMKLKKFDLMYDYKIVKNKKTDSEGWKYKIGKKKYRRRKLFANYKIDL